MWQNTASMVSLIQVLNSKYVFNAGLQIMHLN